MSVSCIQPYVPAKQPFDGEHWKTAMQDGDPADRYLMLEDLIRREGLLGRTEAEIVRLLGPSELPPSFREPALAAAGLAYRLGPERGFMKIDAGARDCGNAWFVIHFGNGRATEFKVITDC